ncbi:class I SAM-dependent methyltransferase, partial [candidate division CSSED10-310 bacterium]
LASEIDDYSDSVMTAAGPRSKTTLDQATSPYKDLLSAFLKYTNEQWVTFTDRIEEGDYRLREDEMRNKVRSHLEKLNQHYDPMQLLVDSDGDESSSLKGKLKGMVKSSLMVMLRPFLLQQQQMNAEVVRFGNSVMEVLDSFIYQQRHYNDQMMKLGDGFVKLTMTMQEARNRLKNQWDMAHTTLEESIRSVLHELYSGLSGLNNRINDLNKHLNHLEKDLVGTQENWEKRNRERMMALHTTVLSHKEAIDHFLQQLAEQQDQIALTVSDFEQITQIESQQDALFEEEHRGSSVDIKNRQSIYIPFFENCQNVIDIGCGRGEFLELLREHDIQGQGAEINAVLVQACRDKKIAVTLAAGHEFLEQQADESVDGIFCAQVIEHVPPPQRLDFLKLAWQKLKAEGYLILETVNPLSVFALTRYYFADPSHHAPVHPDTLQFFAQTAGYTEVQVRFLHPVSEAQILTTIPAKKGHLHELFKAINENIEKLNSFLYGYQDYAVIARK